MRFLPLVLLAAALGPAPAAFRPENPAPFALVLIDADGLACSPCGAPLLEFCRTVRPDLLEERVVGVLTFREGAEPDPRRARLARTRWEGFSRANGIRIPVAVDESHAFDALVEPGMTVLLWDVPSGRLRRWTAPFDPAALREMSGCLVSGKPI